MDENNELIDEAIEVQIPITRIIPEALMTSRFSDDFIIQHRKGHFTLSFFELILPIVLEDTRESTIEAYKQIEHVDSHCVMRVTVSPIQLRRIQKAINTNLETYEHKYGPIEDKEDEL
jgi:hypothetical protein